MKANEIDIVEITENVQGLVKGTQCTIIAAFEKPSEAYDLEYVHPGGADSTFLYSVKPEQFTVVKSFQ